MIERHWREYRIIQRLDKDTAETKHEQRAPAFIAADTNNYLASRWRHRLHYDAFNLCGGPETIPTLQHPPQCRPGRFQADVLCNRTKLRPVWEVARPQVSRPSP